MRISCRICPWSCSSLSAYVAPEPRCQRTWKEEAPALFPSPNRAARVASSSSVRCLETPAEPNDADSPGSLVGRRFPPLRCQQHDDLIAGVIIGLAFNFLPHPLHRTCRSLEKYVVQFASPRNYFYDHCSSPPGIYSYGFEKPSAIQQRGISPIIAGRDTIGQAQSGTGKTATFIIGGLQRIDPNINSIQCLVLAPTRELANQIFKVGCYSCWDEEL